MKEREMSAYSVWFGPVDVDAASEADALRAAATLIASDPDFYKQRVLRWDDSGIIEAEPSSTDSPS